MIKDMDNLNKFVAVRRGLLGIGAVAALFTIVVCSLLMATYFQLRTNDPLNDPNLVALRERYSGDLENAELKERIRDLDWLARRAYFTSQDQIRTGGYLAVGGAVVMLIAFGVLGALISKRPCPEEKEKDEYVWDAIAQSRRWIAGIGLLVFGMSLYLAFTVKTEMGEKEKEKTEDGNLEIERREGGEILKNCTVFRGPYGWGYSEFRNVPVKWSEKENILWKIAVPLSGAGSPVVWGNRIFVVGATRDEREVYCFSAVDGSLMWTGDYEESLDVSDEYEVFDAPESVMYAAATPAVDGKNVYAIFANGEVAAFDIRTGSNIWVKVMGDSRGNAYGLSSSLLIYKGSVIVPFDGNKKTLSRLAGMTGREIWRCERNDFTWASPILIKYDDTPQIVMAGNPEVSGWSVETGKKLWVHKLLDGDVAPSPVYGAGLVFVNYIGCGIFALDPTEKREEKWRVEELKESSFSEIASMVTDGRYLYQFADDILVCIDARTGKVLYEKKMEKESGRASPMIVGNNLYLFCEKTGYVVRVGAEYELLNVFSFEEPILCSPAVVDGRMYFRTKKSLYCVGERVKSK
ncbi:MAG: PQQ-binding-like beta-propeller repeat protein [Kiritimatiellae bacterium]|nr:PQQ-binding-like beta-propeller repeat protein [Kiritimatiellia bacterium]